MKTHHKIYLGDAKEVLKTLPENSVDCVITSPPYYCYAEDTEILTYAGWKTIKEIKMGELVLSAKPQNMELEWVKVTAVDHWKYNGKMMHFQNTHIDLLVTPNHKMFIYQRKNLISLKPKIKSKNNGKFITNRDVEGAYFVEADKVKQGHITPKTNFRWRGKEVKYFTLPYLKTIYNKQKRDYMEKKINIEDWLAFFGLWIAEGSVRGSKGGTKKTYSLSIKQKIPNDNKVREVLKKIPFGFKEYLSKDNIVAFEISDKQLWVYFRKFGNSHTKYIPKQIKELSPRLLRIFLKWYLFGDGTVRRKVNTHYEISCYSVSKKLKDDLSEIALKIGSNISIRRGNTLAFLRRKSIKLQETKKQEHYDGYVYGVEVDKNHTLCVRRNNKIVFSGNSLRDYGEETNLIWDGKEGCEHDWTNINSKLHSGRGGASKIGYVYLKEEIPDTPFNYSFCQKCGAWKGQLGLEETLEQYISHLMQIFREVIRVLKPTGTMFIDIGDTYSSGLGSHGRRTIYDNLTSKEITWVPDDKKPKPPKDYPPKCLLCIPERLMFALLNEGMTLRNKIVWNKPNAMPSSVTDRFKTSWEYIYFFVKQRKYWFDLDAVREKHKIESLERVKHKWNGHREPMSSYEQMDISRMCHDHGKNPGDILYFSPKYELGEGHSNRQGLNRPLSIATIKAYKEYQVPIANYLKKHIKEQHKTILDETFGKYKWRHWIRTDLSVASLPGVEDWFILKEILGFGNEFDDKIDEVQKLNIPIFHSGRTPTDFFEINTQPFSGAHFAVFPPSLPEKLIKAGCPEVVCKKCGKPKKQIIKTGGYTEAFNIRVRDIKTKPEKWGGLYQASDKEIESYDEKNYISKVKKHIISEGCNCGEGYSPGVVLDPFAGSGTTGLIAKQLHRNSIQIELNLKYVYDIMIPRMNFQKTRLNENGEVEQDSYEVIDTREKPL